MVYRDWYPWTPLHECPHCRSRAVRNLAYQREIPIRAGAELTFLCCLCGTVFSNYLASENDEPILILPLPLIGYGVWLKFTYEGVLRVPLEFEAGFVMTPMNEHGMLDWRYQLKPPFAPDLCELIYYGTGTHSSRLSQMTVGPRNPNGALHIQLALESEQLEDILWDRYLNECSPHTEIRPRVRLNTDTRSDTWSLRCQTP